MNYVDIPIVGIFIQQFGIQVIFHLGQKISLRHARKQANPANAQSTKIGAFILHNVTSIVSVMTLIFTFIQRLFLQLYDQAH